MPEHYVAAARCDDGHEQQLKVHMSCERRRVFAGLMDGTSEFYIHSPLGTDPVIGKCGLCGAQIKCEVTGVESGQQCI
jgi:hypothetical protein